MNIAQVDYDGLIPNNVGLGRGPRACKRALEKLAPRLYRLVERHGAGRLPGHRSSICAPPSASIRKGWAKFDYVKMPEYRWGILLAPQDEGRTIPFGEHKGEPAWQEVPGEYRAMLRRLIVIQGDTEPASVEQQRHLGKTAPSLYDLRNLFQVNVEEGRHLWAMVYLLQKYFGRDGREEAEALLRRRSGDADTPRMLGAFNEATPDWLSFFMFTFFTDRDGKMQLDALAQSGFDPLSRTCRFMLTEEAHHMFVGETGVSRIVQRTCEAMKAAGIERPQRHRGVRALGVIDLPTIQKKVNLHFSLTLDLFGNEISTNAANAFNAGLKGRYREDRLKDDHQLQRVTYPVLRLIDGTIQNADDAGALRAQHAAARRLRRRRQCRRRALEQGDRRDTAFRSRSSCRTSPSTAISASSPRSRRTWTAICCSDGGLGEAPQRFPAVRRRPRIHRESDAAPIRDRQIRQLDRAAAGRHR